MDADRAGGGDEHRVTRGPDGKYRWVHETNLYRNPVFLFLIWKIFFFVWLAIAAFVLALSVPGRNAWENFRSIGLAMVGVLAFLAVLITISYYIYAVFMGGKYCVLFEMDTKGVTHTQVARQFRRARRLGIAGRTGRYCHRQARHHRGRRSGLHPRFDAYQFNKVNSVKVKRKRYTIKLRSSLLMHNQVYTAPEDFEFVVGFIAERVRSDLPGAGSRCEHVPDYGFVGASLHLAGTGIPNRKCSAAYRLQTPEALPHTVRWCRGRALGQELLLDLHDLRAVTLDPPGHAVHMLSAGGR